jgi:hypothetical protein
VATRKFILLPRESDAVMRASGDAVTREPDVATRKSNVEKLVSFSSRLFREVIS